LEALSDSSPSESVETGEAARSFAPEMVGE
jgi:hypothetical protein